VSAPEQAEGSAASDALRNALGVLRRRWPVMLGVLVACIGVAVYKHHSTPKSYDASSSVSFQTGTLSGAALQVSSSGSSEPQREADTEVLVCHSPAVADAVRAQLHVRSSTSELLEEVKCEAAANANVLNITATSSQPTYAAELANAFAQQYIAFRARSQLSGLTSSQAKLEQQVAELPAGSSERLSLQQSLQRLEEAKAVAGSGANIIGQATPPGSPTGMTLTTTLLIAVLVALAIAFTLVFLLETLDRRVKSVEEFEREYRLSALTVVPQNAFRVRRAADRQELLEPYRILRSALEFASVTRQLDTLLVTSANSSEGKTTVAIDLAHAVALTGRETVLMELDLRRPTFAKHFELHTRRGLTDVLTGAGRIEEVLLEPFEGLPNLSVLPSGRIPQNPSELLSSPRIAEVISELVTEEGIVIVDAPPLNPVADTQILLNNEAIHATLLVARVGQTTRDDARRARGILERHMVNPIGVVVTGAHEAHRYGYAAYSSDAAELEVGAAPPAHRLKTDGLRL